LLEAGPVCRRQFMDGGVFHVEHGFARLWQRYNRALKQRNVALNALKNKKAPMDFTQVHIWEQELCETAYAIDTLRAQYLDAWFPIFSRILKEILGTEKLSLHYKRGWAPEETLECALKEAFSRDKTMGYTTVGPHRADLNFEINSTPARALLSRGQLKLFICALFLARAEALFSKTTRKCVFMIDDLQAELDMKAAELLIERLEGLEGQVIITAIEKDPLLSLFKGKAHKMFHVEHGVVRLG
jgi:DNA replication and repair protein RecF